MSRRSKLPVVSGRDLVKALHRIGFEPARQKGDHVFMKHQDGRRTTVPLHAEINKSTLMDILEQVGITKEQFIELL